MLRLLHMSVIRAEQFERLLFQFPQIEAFAVFEKLAQARVIGAEFLRPFLREPAVADFF